MRRRLNDALCDLASDVLDSFKLNEIDTKVLQAVNEARRVNAQTTERLLCVRTDLSSIFIRNDKLTHLNMANSAQIERANKAESMNGVLEEIG